MSRAPVLVGIAGWSYDDWKDVVYPARTKNRLQYLADYLDCIEVNSSFYHPFSSGTAERWVRDVSRNPRFRFTAKAWSRFTHDTKTPYGAEDIETFVDGLRPLQESGTLAGLLFQFPFFFVNTPPNRDLLRRLAEDFSAYPRILEVRDASWQTPESLELMRDLGMNVACLDMPLSRNAFRADVVTTGPMGYLRMHGRNRKAWFSKEAERDDKYDYLYEDKELEGILDRVERLREEAKSVVMVWNNHFRGKAAVNAFQSLSAITGEKVVIPEPLIETYPGLSGIAKPAPGMLF